MRAIILILSCISLMALSECAITTNAVKCEIGSFKNVRIKADKDILQMQAEGDLHNYKLGYSPRATAPFSKPLRIDVITTCYDTYCQALFKETSDSGGYYLTMNSNGYIYETSSTTSDARYFDYAYSTKYNECRWYNRVRGTMLSVVEYNSKTGGYFIVGDNRPSILKYKFIN